MRTSQIATSSARDAFNEALAILWRDDPPAWFAAVLTQYTDRIAAYREVDENIPLKTELRDVFSGIEQGAAIIRRNLSKTALHYLQLEGSEQDIRLEDLACLITEVERRASALLKRIPTKKGDKAVLPRWAAEQDDTMSAEELTTVVGTIFWKHQKGHWPGVNHQEAHRLLSSIWEASGGDAHDGSWTRCMLKVGHRNQAYAELAGKVRTAELLA